MSFSKLSFILSATTFALSSPWVHAGPYTDDLAKCLVSATSNADRTLLVKWMFSAASSHPDVKSITANSAAHVDEHNKKLAELMVRLLTESCKEKTREALKYEGASTIGASFQVLGQVAGRELFSHPEVVKNLSGLEKHIDRKKLEQLGASAK
jgi:hypothetical protein